MKLLKRVGLVVAGLVFAFVAIGWVLPSKAHVERAVVIHAPASAVYPLIANLKNGWVQWSPWGVEVDPTLKISYRGPEEGVGASQAWQSESSGDGQLTLRSADPTRGVEYDASLMHDTFRLTAALVCGAGDSPSSTRVTWVCDVDLGNHLLWRYFGAFGDRFLGRDMAKGLSQLKAKAEARAQAQGVAGAP